VNVSGFARHVLLKYVTCKREDNVTSRKPKMVIVSSGGVTMYRLHHILHRIAPHRAVGKKTVATKPVFFVNVERSGSGVELRTLD